MVYEWKCLSCGTHVEVNRPIAECAVPPDEQCSGCLHPEPGNWQRVYRAAMVMNVALPDGTKRAGFAELAQAARLEAERGDIRPEKRGHIDAEIAKLRSVKK